jgi:hypothetical protein
VTGRQIIGVPVLAAANRETLVAMLAPAIQHTLLPGNSGATGTG